MGHSFVKEVYFSEVKVDRATLFEQSLTELGK